MKPNLILMLFISLPVPAFAHDTWVATNTNLIREGDAIYVDLKLGNHGNNHRDFKLASKVQLDACTLAVIHPDGSAYDLKASLFDTGYAPKEGFWRGKFAGSTPGLYTVAHSFDKIVNHGRPIRAVKSGKTFFVVSPNLDRVTTQNPGYDRPLGHAMEIVPVANPVTPMGPGQQISVQLLFKGDPLPETRISFIPQCHRLQEGFDDEYERRTDEHGKASFTPRTGNQYLIVAHYQADNESSDKYDLTAYAATLTVFVPEVCPCCGD